MSYRSLCAAAGRIKNHGYAPFVTRASGKARVISAPHRWLADLQTNLARTVLARLRAADCVYSQRGRDPIQNARQHVGNPYMLVLDIRDCYPSVTVERVRLAFIRCGFTRHVADLLTKLVTTRGQLPQGASTSAAVLNCVLYDSDEELTELAQAHGVVYTRFVDDICLSGDTPVRPLRRQVSRLLARQGFQVGTRKTKLYDPGDAKILTKIVVADPLRATPAFLTELDAIIDAFGRGRGICTEASIRGKINWVARLNPVDGQRYLSRLERALTRRRLSTARS